MAGSGSRPAITATRIGAGPQYVKCVFLRDAADGNQRLFDEGPAAADLFDSGDGVRIEFGGGGEDRAERDVIHRFAAGRAELRHVVAGESDRRIGTHQAACIARRQIVLAYMEPGIQEQCEIGAVVDHQRGPGFAAEARHGARGFEEAAAPVPLVADLKDTGASLQKRGGGGFQCDSAAIERFRIENRVDPGKPHG